MALFIKNKLSMEIIWQALMDTDKFQLQVRMCDHLCKLFYRSVIISFSVQSSTERGCQWSFQKNSRWGKSE